jgi:Fe-S-cluster containining protein
MFAIEPLTQEARRLANILGDSAIHDRASEAATAAQDSFERRLAVASVGHIDCRKGCAHCCHVHVSATAPEIFPIARALAQFTVSAASDRVVEAARLIVGLDSEQRGRQSIPCSLLGDDSLCSMYEIRPLNCRRMASRSEPQCFRVLVEGHDEGIPVPRAYERLGDGQAIALRSAIRSLGLSDDRYELTAALATVLPDAHAEQRWLAGEEVFGSLPEANVVRSSELDKTVAAVVEALLQPQQSDAASTSLSFQWRQ